MAHNILIGIFVYLKPSMERMSFLAVPTQASYAIYAEHILLIKPNVFVFFTTSKAALQKGTKPISFPFFWKTILPHLQNPSIDIRRNS